MDRKARQDRSNDLRPMAKASDFHPEVLGLFDKFAPKFSKRYVNLKEVVTGAVRRYIEEVQEGEFPTDAHSFHPPKIVEKVATGG